LTNGGISQSKANRIGEKANSVHLIEQTPKPQSIGSDDTPVMIESPLLSDGVFQVKVQTTAKRTYYLEKRGDFTLGAWATIDSLPGDDTLRTFSDRAPSGLFACYRIRVE